MIMSCKSCGQPLSNPLRQLSEMPVPQLAEPDGIRHLPTIPVGACAVDPNPAFWQDGIAATTTDCLVINPADSVGVVSTEDPHRNSGCCGHDGLGGPNLLCQGCQGEVATLLDDCWTAVEVRFEPDSATVEPAQV